MAEKNDDIKNLFLNLGLNPGDYHEIRSAPTANATVGEAPRRWSLLQSAAPPARPQSLTPAAPAPAAPTSMPSMPWADEPAAPAAPVSRAAPAKAPDDAPVSLSAVLLAAAQDIARAESNSQSFAGDAPGAAGELPGSLAGALAAADPADGLQSLFQSVKEPQTASVMPAFSAEDRPTERRTEQLGRVSQPLTPAARAAAVAPAVSSALLPEAAPRLVDAFDEPETRHAPPQPSRLGPMPPPAAPPIASPAMSASSAGAPLAPRLRFAVKGSEPVPGHGESLQDVFARLARDNRSR